MNRVVVLGRAGAGKSTAAARLGRLRDLPVVELDKHFWSPDLAPPPRDVWAERQRMLTAPERWVLDGDLGRDDDPTIRLARADTVLLLDYSVARCAWRAVTRSRERADFWWALLTWRRQRRPALLDAIARLAPAAAVHVLRTSRDLDQLLNQGRTSGTHPIGPGARPRLTPESLSKEAHPMERTAINPWDWSRRFAFNQAERVDGPRRFLFCAGQTAVDGDGTPQHAGDIAAQLGLALDNLETVLAQGDMSLADVVRLTTYTTDVDGLFPHYGLLTERLEAAGVRPASTLLGVARLAFPELLIEIEATAVR